MNKRTLFFVGGGICLLAVVGLFVAKHQIESGLRKDIANFFATLPAPLSASVETIDVSAINKTITLRNIKGQYKNSGNDNMEFSIARVEAVGVNVDAFKKDVGTTTLAKSLTIIDSLCKYAGGEARMEREYLEDISGDGRLLLAELAKALPAITALQANPDFSGDHAAQTKAAGELAGVVRAYETFSIAKTQVTNYSYTIPVDDNTIRVVADSVDLQKYSLREMGPFSVTGIRATFDDTPFMKLDSITCDGVELPSFVGLLQALGKEEMASSNALQATLKDQPFALKNLRSKNLVLYDPETADRMLFSLGDTLLSYEARAAHTVETVCNGMSINRTLLEESGLLPDEALALLPKVVVFESAFRATAMKKEDDAYDIACNELRLKEPALGEITSAFSINNFHIFALIMGAPGPAALKNFDVTVRDAGMLEFAFALATLGTGETPEALRAQAVAELAHTRDTLPNDTLKGLADAVGTFLERSGSTLKITIAPEKPLNLSALQAAALTSPEDLGLTYSATSGD